jgi:CheY-like chemotaxis protein
MTANAMAHQRAAYLAAGMNGAVAKPLSPSVLVQTLIAALDGVQPGPRAEVLPKLAPH